MDDDVKRRIKLALVALALLLLAGARGSGGAGPPTVTGSSDGSSRRPRHYWPKATFANGSLCARQVLSLNPSNLAACQLMAGLAEMAGSPALLDWRRRIAEVSPTPENRLSLASTALRLQRPPYPLTAQILDDLRAAATNLPDFHVVSADLAIRLKELDKAELHFAAAARLEPTNELHQLNLATLRLASDQCRPRRGRPRRAGEPAPKHKLRRRSPSARWRPTPSGARTSLPRRLGPTSWSPTRAARPRTASSISIFSCGAKVRSSRLTWKASSSAPSRTWLK